MKKYGLPVDGGAVSDHVEVEMKKSNFKEFEEGVLSGDRIIKEAYPLEAKKKMTISYTLSTMTWRGDAYDCATPEISYCCNDAVKRFTFHNSNVPSPGREPVNFCKMVYQGNPVDICPFCGAEIEINKAK